jgi:HAD superfamily hydrolase (TIGR01549 family)
MIKLIIFDYDGVIVDSFANVYDVYKIIFKKLNKECPKSLEEFRQIYGTSSSECYGHLNLSEQERTKGNEIFKEEILKKEPPLFQGIAEVIQQLNKNLRLALISSNYEGEVKQKLEKKNLIDFFDIIVARTNSKERFTKTDAIKKEIENSGLNQEEILLIGDRNLDFIEGSRAGLKNILLVDYGWGYHLEEMPGYEQKAIVKSPIEIIEAIKKFD